jgi:nitrous oxidase accessory protein NosD
MLLMLFTSTIPLMLNTATVEASITGPSLAVDNILNQVHATLGAAAGSAITVKGTVTNHAAPPPGPGGWLTGVFYKEIGGPGIIPPDLTLLWSMDGITWWPAGPIWCPTAYPGYDLELIIGAGGYYIPIGFSSTTYIKTITNRNINPADVEAVVFEDLNANGRYDPGEPRLSTGDMPVEVDISVWNTAELDPAIFFSTIQAAINAATPGQTIYVYDGIYKENVNVNKALTIEAASHPIIDGGAAGNCISIGANGVVISGFEIRNGYNGISGQTSGSTFSNNTIHDNLNILGSAGVGILLWGNNDNNVITQNMIYSNDRQGIFIGYYSTASISTGNTISYNTIFSNGLYRYANGPDASEYGIQLWTADNNLIENNEIYDHDDWFPYGGTFDFAQGIYLCDSDSNTVVNNNLHNNNYAVGLWHPSRPVVTNFIHYNDIWGNTGYGVRTFDGAPLVDARFNWWGDASGPNHASNPSGTGNTISNNVDYSPWLGFVVGTSPMTWHVNPTGTIQEAIGEADSGDTIIVHDGTYNEALYINKNLVIRAASTPIIRGCQMRATNYGNRQATVFVENAASVVLQDLDIEGQGLDVPAGTKSYAVLYENSGGVVQGCTVSPNTIGDMASAAIAAWDNSVLTISDCVLHNFGRIGVYANNATLTIQNNTIVGQVYSQNNQVNYGIEIEDYSGPSVATITQNVIYNCNNTHPSPLWSSAAIIVDTWREWADVYGFTLLPSRVSIAYNEIYDNYESIEIVSNDFSYAHYNKIGRAHV